MGGTASSCTVGVGAVLAGSIAWWQCEQMRRGRISPLMQVKIDRLWHRLAGGSGVVTRSQAAALWPSKVVGKLSIDAMFSQVDVDRDGTISKAEWDGFWSSVKRHGYSEATIMDEVDNIIDGSAWVDWRDGREPQHPSKGEE
eukprot:TRINITY_DN21464_c0_g1_i2.p2 TRINITY_DN21464_c0_g1~~TRINITY_DN21464_c0_g1_i2.p2  ORF type:complete len:142 (-),score=22.87 TRINITY_DN21464_c0_g1_i2:337-762(-)